MTKRAMPLTFCTGVCAGASAKPALTAGVSTGSRVKEKGKQAHMDTESQELQLFEKLVSIRQRRLWAVKTLQKGCKGC